MSESAWKARHVLRLLRSGIVYTLNHDLAARLLGGFRFIVLPS